MSIYQSVFLSPSNTTIDATLANVFECTLQGSSIDKYNLTIYKVSDNTQVYTTGDITISPAKFNGDILQVTVPNTSGMLNGTQYKWQIKTYSGTANATTIQVVFNCNTTPTLVWTSPQSSITSQSYTFNFTYTQAEGVPVSNYYITYYDYLNNIIETTPLNFSGNISDEFSGFVSDSNYSVQATVLTQGGLTITSPKYTFGVTYLKPTVSIIPSLVLDTLTSFVTMTIGALIQISAVVTGTYAILNNYGMTGNNALRVNSSSTVRYDISVPQSFNWSSTVNLASFTTGDFLKLSGTDGDYKVGYDGTRFYYNNKGVMGYTPLMAKPSVDFIVNIKPTEVCVVINGTQTKFVTG